MQTFIVMIMWVFIWLMEKRECEKWKRKALWYENEYLKFLQSQVDDENKDCQWG